MKKLVAILFAIVLLVAGLGYVAYLNSSTILAELISRQTLTPVSIMNIDWHKEGFTIEDMTIGNPKKARFPTALRVKTLSVDAPYGEYFSSPIVIDRIHLDDIYLNVQIYNEDRTEGNWHTLMENLSATEDKFFSIERTVNIKKLILTNIQIDLILSDGKLHHLSPIDRLEFDNVNSDKGVVARELTEIIVKKMMHSVFLQKGLEAIIEAPADVIKGVLPFL